MNDNALKLLYFIALWAAFALAIVHTLQGISVEFLYTCGLDELSRSY